MVQPPSILIIDDDLFSHETLANLLEPQSYSLRRATSGPEGLELACAQPPDLILLDVMMPGMDGFEVCRRLRATPRLSEVPIILVTALDDRASRLRGIEAGADDFISKPYDRIELRARVAAILRLNRYRQLLHERLKFEQVVELAPDGMAVVDAEGTFLLANSALGQMLALPQPPRAGTSLRPLLGDGRAWAALSAALEAGSTARQVLVDLAVPGHPVVPVEISAGTILWEGAQALLLSLRDVSERRRAEERIRRQVERLDTLHLIDRAIVASSDLQTTLTFILDQALRLLRVDAGAVLVRRPGTASLNYVVVRGFARDRLPCETLSFGEGPAGAVAATRRILHLEDLRAPCGGPLQLDGEPGDRHGGPLQLDGEPGDYRGVPLIAGGQVEGVLELFHQQHLVVDSEWEALLESLAAQFALSIGHARLFDSLVRANDELARAYDSTLAGWAHALELRDKETEGHTQRVTEMTLSLARAMGLSEADLVHVRRGALLHDIGKMGIPDTILLKAGPLSDEEWMVMRRHPGYAYEMLAPIAYLQPALDIPFFHHERWDGSGYPRGLAGDTIPLAARIFAVVDVWDALYNDRPYRKAWPEAQVYDYIKRMAGTLFDPSVVEAFLALRAPQAEPPPVAVLAVDDDYAVLAVLRKALADQYRVFVTTSPAEALAILRCEPIAVLIADQRMPELRGVQLLERAREISPQTLGILTSAYLDGEALSAAINLDNVRAFLAKPWSLDELRGRVGELVAQYRASPFAAHRPAALDERTAGADVR